jgi:hypothetical protein
MKTQRSVWLVLAVAIVATVSIGAQGQKSDRPAWVAEERWISVGERAGFALTSEYADTSVGAELYLKTPKGWRRARVENPVSAQPLSR